MEQTLLDIKIPETCKECFETPFKKPKPECWYEKAFHLRKLVKFFKEDLDLDLGIDVNAALAQLRPLCSQCLATIGVRAKEIQQQEFMKQLNNTIVSLKDDIEELKNHNEEKDIHGGMPIYKQQEEMEAQAIKVNKKPKIPGIKIETVEKREMTPHGGWKVFQRNIKSENLAKYLKDFKKRKPELGAEIDKAINGKQTDFIDISNNKMNNLIVKYRDIE